MNLKSKRTLTKQTLAFIEQELNDEHMHCIYSSYFNTQKYHLIFQHLVISAPLADLLPRLGCVIASISLHKALLFGTMRAPLTFFDTTPTGRILSRFSKDIDVIDTQIPTELSDLIYVIFEVNVFD